MYDEARKGDVNQSQARLEAIKPFRMLDIDDEARNLAEMIIDGKAIPAEYPEDALHVGVASVNGMDAVLTWNSAHLNSPFTRLPVREIIESGGYACPEICSPLELLEIDR